MILGPKKLLELVKTQKLVEGLSERELINPEGAGFDLRLGEVYKISGKAFLGEVHRKTAEIELIAKYYRHSGERSDSRISKKTDSGQVLRSRAQDRGARMTDEQKTALDFQQSNPDYLVPLATYCVILQQCSL